MGSITDSWTASLRRMFDLDVFGGAWYVTFYRHVYELNPSNFYTYTE